MTSGFQPGTFPLSHSSIVTDTSTPAPVCVLCRVSCLALDAECTASAQSLQREERVLERRDEVDETRELRMARAWSSRRSVMLWSVRFIVVPHLGRGSFERNPSPSDRTTRGPTRIIPHFSSSRGAGTVGGGTTTTERMYAAHGIETRRLKARRLEAPDLDMASWLTDACFVGFDVVDWASRDGL